MSDLLVRADYRNCTEYLEYQAAIEAIIYTVPRTDENPDGEITIRGLHQRLGYRARPEWTLDALNGLKSITSRGVTITRFYPITGMTPRYKQLWNGDGMRWIFAGAKAQEREADYKSSAS